MPETAYKLLVEAWYEGHTYKSTLELDATTPIKGDSLTIFQTARICPSQGFHFPPNNVELHISRNKTA